VRRAEHVLRLSPPLLLGGVVVALLLACRGPAGTTSGALPYLDDASYRRSELLASLVSPKDGYATLREAFYATGKAGDWDELEEWDPPVRRVAVEELDGRGSRDEQAARSSVLALPPPPSSEDDPSLLAFGRAAFQSYPVQAAPYLEVAIASRESAARYGLWLDDERGVGGLVRARMADGTEVVSVTCCTCHARRVGSRIVDGLPNANLELGEAILDATRGTVDPAIAAWGAGRIDVSSRSGTEPARIPDLRPVAWLGYLQQDATVRVVDRTSLAIRIETLIITSQNEAVRPPRIVTLALAAYVRSLASELTGSPADGELGRGARIFGDRCAGCHRPPALTGPPIALDVIGTDPTLGRSLERGTGRYRVPSLRGVGSRGPLLHDGTVPSVSALFDPARPTEAYTERLHGSGAVPGHLFGLDLDASDRAALVAYVQSL
jgi:mono/diheme cytochrome c family protein